MSLSYRPTHPAEVRERATCMCSTGGACTSFAPGHALHLIQARLVSATPTGWVDGVVESIDGLDRSLIVRDLAGGTHQLWNGQGAADRIRVGEPVAVHARYHVLAAGTARWNVLALS